MRPSTRKTVIASVLLSCVLVFVAEQVFAQNPTIKGKGKYLSTVTVQNLATLAGFSGDTVAEKTTLVITDVIFSNTSNSTTATVQVFRQGADPSLLTHPIRIPADQTFAYNFGTGLEIGAGNHPSLIVTGASVGFTLIGYLRKG